MKSNNSTQNLHVKYRMPYVWTAIHLADVICSGSSDSLDRNNIGSGSNSLGKLLIKIAMVKRNLI